MTMLFWIAICSPLLALGEGDQIVALSDLSLAPVITGWKKPGKNVNCEGRQLILNGRRYESGVGGCPYFRWDIDLLGRASRFEAVVGVNDDTRGKGSVQFIVQVDGKVAFDSGVLRAQDTATVAINLKGAKLLQLLEHDGGDGITSDHGDWCDAYFTMIDGAIPRSVAAIDNPPVNWMKESGEFSQSLLSNSLALMPRGTMGEFAMAVAVSPKPGPIAQLYATAPRALLRWQIKDGVPVPRSYESIYGQMPLKVDPTDEVLTDNFLAATPDGGLVTGYVGSTKRNTPNKPEWWSYNEGRRGIILGGVLDGATNRWTHTAIDALYPFGGRYAWPQGSSEGKWFGGWDRLEMYADPFSSNVFASMNGCAGTAPGYESHRSKQSDVFLSHDGGRSWAQDPYFVPYPGVPILMTTNPQGRLFLVHWEAAVAEGNVPMVAWLDPPYQKVTGFTFAPWSEAPKRGWMLKKFENVSPPISHHGIDGSISRLKVKDGGSGVRFVFPASEDGKAVAKVMVCLVGQSGKATSKVVHTLRAAEASGSILGPVMVQISDPETAKKTDLTLLYWHETFPSLGMISVKGILIEGEDHFSEPFFLSTTDGKARYWKPNPTAWRGDYYRGASHVSGGTIYFVAAWPEWAATEKPIMINANVVKVKVP